MITTNDGSHRLLRRAGIACALAACAWASAAQAAWEFTEWGMTVDEVIAAADGSARQVRDERDNRIWEQRMLAKGTIVEGGIEYEVGYYFDKDSKRLTLVDLNFPAEHCDATLARMVARLGSGEVERRRAGEEGETMLLEAEITKWRTAGSDERTHFVDIHLRSGTFRFCKVLTMEREIETD